MTALASPGAMARRRMAALRLWGRNLPTPEQAVAHLVAVQAQEHLYARWSVGQRSGATAREVDAAFDAGRFLRTHVLRPTWHYVAREDLRWLIALSGPMVDARNALRHTQLGLDARTRTRATDVIAAAVADRPLTRHEVAAVLNDRRIGTDGQRLPHLLMHAELHGAICSGPMRGREHTYAAFDDRVPARSGPTGDAALAELATRYFVSRGPATVRDFAWWAGLRAADARTAVEMVRADLSSAVVEGRTYWFADGRDSAKRPRVDLVQCYDEVIISYTESRDVLATPAIAFPVPRSLDGFTHVALLDGRLAGHWRVDRRHGVATVETRMARTLNEAERAALGAAVARYDSFAALSR